MGRRPPPGPGPPLLGDQPADGRIDGNHHADQHLAPARDRRIPARPRPDARTGGAAGGGGSDETTMRDRLRLAVPNKGRLKEPTLELLHAAGLRFEVGERNLLARVANLALDLLFVRVDDVGEFVADGVADLGVTGLDLLLEAGLDLPILRRLGFGRCRLTVAVPDPSPVRSLTDLAGARIATGHPRSTRHALAELGLTVEIVPVSGAV